MFRIESSDSMCARDGGALSDTERSYPQDRLDQFGSNIHWMARNGW